jgi:hypothetical protein
MVAPPGRDRNTRSPRRWIMRRGMGACRRSKSTAIAQRRRHRWSRKRNARPFADSGIPCRNCSRNGRRKSTAGCKVTPYDNFEEFEEFFRRRLRQFLVDRLGVEVRPEAPRTQIRHWESSPFRGLNVFDFEHAPIFHGRTKAIGEAFEAIELQLKARRPFVLIVGASGSGSRWPRPRGPQTLAGPS